MAGSGKKNGRSQRKSSVFFGRPDFPIAAIAIQAILAVSTGN